MTSRLIPLVFCLIVTNACAAKKWPEINVQGATVGGDALLTIDGMAAAANYGLRLVGEFRNGRDDQQGRYLTEFGAGWPGLATNAAIAINGAAGEHVPIPIAGHGSFMFGVNSDVGLSPTIVMQTSNVGPLIKGYRQGPESDSPPEPIFDVAVTGKIFSAALTPARILASDDAQNITAPYAFDTDPMLSANLDTSIVSQAAIKAYVDNAIRAASIRNLVNITSATGTTDDDSFIMHVQYTETGPVTLMLGSAQCHSVEDDGRQLIIKDAGGNAAVNHITIRTEGAETIDGRETRILNTNYSSIRLYCYGGQWFVSDHNRGDEGGLAALRR